MKKPEAAAPQSTESGPLKEVFDEFRAELGEMGAEDEDLETHYNLGIAFREMGLLEEAIGEFQKVAKASDRGRPFRYTMQCCTLLGLAFMEKGQPAIAAIWYERALQTPGMDPESTLALRYDLALLVVVAFEMGALLLYLPWSVYWEQNYFLSHYPSLMHIVLHPTFRGVVSGIGVLDIMLAIGWIGARPGPDRVPPR